MLGVIGFEATFNNYSKLEMSNNVFRNNYLLQNGVIYVSKATVTDSKSEYYYNAAI